MQSQYNMRSPAVKRLMKEAQELREPTEQYHVQPLDDNLFEWHFTIRGPADSDFDGGMYHGRIILPPEYPMKPPSIILLTPNGRFEIFKKICLSISGHHPESWQPSWSIRTALLAIIGFMPTHGAGAIGSLDYSPEERKVLAKKSQDWKCPNCGCIGSILPPVTQASKKTTQEAKELATQINFQAEKPKDNTQSKNISASNSDTSEITKPANEETNSATPPSAIPNNFQPTQFPWNPFMATPSPGMMPPFGFPMSHANSGNTLVPRFPLPCYAPAPVFPPGMNIQNIGPWLPQQPNMHPSTQTMPNMASGSVSSQTPTVTSSTTVTSDVTTPVSTSTSLSPLTNVTTTATTTPTSPTESSSVTSTPSTTTNATTDGLRQRQTNANTPAQTIQNAEIPRQRQSNADFSLVLIVILVCAIGLLIFRKLYSVVRWSLVNEYI